MDRLEALRRNLDRSMVGAEIGPFFSPAAAKADGWKTVVVDFSSGEELRDRARNHTAASIRDRVDQIEDVDAVWTGEPLDELCLPLVGGKLDYVLASHVIEHMPDLVGFLQQCSRMLKEDGVISLAVPDMRKCFDLLKTPTATREVLTAHRERRTKHTPETLFEARGYATSRGDGGAWLAGTTTPISFTAEFAHAATTYAHDLQRMDGPYVDAHAWHFTPASFELVMLELNVMGLTDFAIDWLELSPGSEFITQLRRRRLGHQAAELQKLRLDLALRRYAEFAAELPEVAWPQTKQAPAGSGRMPGDVTDSRRMNSATVSRVLHRSLATMRQAATGVRGFVRRWKHSPGNAAGNFIKPAEYKGRGGASVEFALVVEQGVLERQALLLCRSVRRFGGSFADVPIVAISPRPTHRPSAATLATLADLGVRYLPLEVHSVVPEYGSTFRMYAAAELERRSAAEHILFLDSDLVFVGEPDLDLRGADAALRPVDVKGMCTEGPDDPNDAYWRRLCEVCEVNYELLPFVETTVQRSRVKASYNGGFVLVRREQGIFARALDYFERSVAAGLAPHRGSGLRVQAGHGLVSERGSEFWGSSQAALSLAIWGSGLKVRTLPPTHNYPLNTFAHLDDDARRISPTVIHYHHLFDGDDRDNPMFNGSINLPDEIVDWLKQNRQVAVTAS